MADQPFNIAKGRVVEFYNRVKTNDPVNSAFVLVLLQATESDAILVDYDNLGSLLANNTEANFDNYGRISITDTELSALPAPDNTNNRFDIDMPDQIFFSAGGAGTDNNLVKALICYDPNTETGTDTDIIPCAHYDFVVTTDGTNITLEVNASGFYRAS